MTMLALSSMSKSSRFVGDHVCGPDVLHQRAASTPLRGITGRSSFAWLSPTDTLEQLGDVIFRARAAATTCRRSPPCSRVVVLIGGSAWILERRVRGVEVVQ